VVYVPNLGDQYCGKDRPEHFHGVTTVVSRLFNMVQPDVAVFGKKDYQQLTIIRKMVEDLAYPIQVVGVDTIRSDEGLALSSRNGYLTANELSVAPELQKSLQWLAARLQEKSAVASKSWAKKLADETKATLKAAGFTPQYIEVCQRATLMPAKKGDRELVILGAAYLGKARLIDNLEVTLGSE
jgi:pantoate--beta-alanine ligase